MQVAQFPASAASALIDGYRDDFVAFAAVLAQTLEQISMRGIPIDDSRASLELVERGMREMAEAVRGLLSGGRAPLPLTSRWSGHPDEPGKASSAIPGAPPLASAPPADRPVVTADGLPHEPVLKGSNQSMPMLSVCQFLGRTRKSGTMHVTVGDERMTFEFKNGFVQHTTSSGGPANKRIGEVLIAMGFCGDRDLAAALSDSAAAGLTVGERVLRSKIVTHGQLLEALERQVQLRFVRACRAPLASYEFEEGACPTTDGRIHITPFELAWQQQHAGKE
ncbi:MAG: DUF4388 domain-containing protein [Planctomycetes bacterium]|nr:DUF4388 domain-containing protein [Planctomycetota bacterium]